MALTDRMMLDSSGDALMQLRSELRALDVERNALDLEMLGYTVVENAAPVAFFDELRTAILEASAEDVRLGRAKNITPNTQAAFQLLVRGRVFEQAVTSPKLLALTTYLLGPNCQVSNVSSNVIGQGAAPQPIHTDSTFIPSPLPPYAQIANAIWCCDDFTADGGATLVVPGSHRLGAPPQLDALVEVAQPIECPKGSIILLHGSVWHCGGARTIPGKRVGLLVYYSRMYLRPQEDYYHLVSDEILARNPPRLARLIGRENPYARPDRYGPDVDRFMPALAATQHPFG